ncbi:MAG: PAS domain S-box protein, partial [Desulfobacterales bacterium]|nr:PAS domain S-box protein [Desulfobacterales bacterium]
QMDDPEKERDGKDRDEKDRDEKDRDEKDRDEKDRDEKDRDEKDRDGKDRDEKDRDEKDRDEKDRDGKNRSKSFSGLHDYGILNESDLVGLVRTRVSDGRILSANNATAAYLGYADVEEMLADKCTLIQFYSAEKRAEVLNELTENGFVSRFEVTLTLKDGTERDVLISARIHPGLDCIEGAVVDNTGRKRAEKAQRESDDRFRALVETTSDWIWELDREGVYTYVNPKIKALLGYDASEVIGRTPFDFMPEEEAARLRARFADMAARHQPIERLENVNLHKDGRRVTLETSGAPFFDAEGSLLGYRGVDRDVTDRKRTEDALRESEQKYRTILESIGEGYFEADLKGNLTFFNESTRKMLGYSREELLGINYRAYSTSETAARIYRIFNRIYQSGKPSTITDYEIIRKDGAIITNELTASLRQDQWGRPIGFRGVSRDVTETKKLQDQLLHAQKMESIGAIASGMAHNFRNILAAVSFNTQLIQMKHAEDPSLMKIADRITNSVEKGTKLVDGLMQFSRKERSGKLKVLNITEVIQETGDLIQLSFDKKINIEVDLPGPVPIMGDHSGLSQVIMNLCTNARDAMPMGGALRIEARKEEDRIRITISDTGYGMDKETRDKCFDPFFTTKEVEKGTGLGLSTSYGIIKEHGGDISVRSKPGKGSVFRIHLPLMALGERGRVAKVQRVAPGKGQKVLIVDDESELSTPLKEILESMGYRAASAGCGKDALVKYEAWRPDVVLMDRNMPEMDGITCAEKIAEKDPGAGIILVSGYDRNGMNGIDLESRPFIKGYITKPLGAKKLSHILSEFFNPSGVVRGGWEGD